MKYYMMIICFLLICSCKEEIDCDMVTCPENTDGGYFELIEEAVTYLPPIANKKIVYINEDGDERIFTADEEILHSEEKVLDAQCIGTCSTTGVEYRFEYYQIQMHHEDIEFTFKSYFGINSVDSISYFDRFRLQATLNDEYKQQIIIFIDDENDPKDGQYSWHRDSVTVLDRDFENVYAKGNFSSDIYYKQEIGIIAFVIEPEDGIWVFDRIE